MPVKCSTKEAPTEARVTENSTVEANSEGTLPEHIPEESMQVYKETWDRKHSDSSVDSGNSKQVSHSLYILSCQEIYIHS